MYLSSVPFPSPSKALKNDIPAFVLGVQHERDNAEIMPASSLVVSLGKALSGIPPFLCGRQMVGPSFLPAAVTQSDGKDLQTEHMFMGMNESKQLS